MPRRPDSLQQQIWPTKLMPSGCSSAARVLAHAASTGAGGRLSCTAAHVFRGWSGSTPFQGKGQLAHRCRMARCSGSSATAGLSRNTTCGAAADRSRLSGCVSPSIVRYSADPLWQPAGQTPQAGCFGCMRQLQIWGRDSQLRACGAHARMRMLFLYAQHGRSSTRRQASTRRTFSAARSPVTRCRASTTWVDRSNGSTGHAEASWEVLARGGSNWGKAAAAQPARWPRTCDRAPEPKSLSTSQCRCAGWSSHRCQPSAKSSAPHTQQLMATRWAARRGGCASGGRAGGGLQRGSSKGGRGNRWLEQWVVGAAHLPSRNVSDWQRRIWPPIAQQPLRQRRREAAAHLDGAGPLAAPPHSISGPVRGASGPAVRRASRPERRRRGSRRGAPRAGRWLSA